MHLLDRNGLYLFILTLAEVGRILSLDVREPGDILAQIERFRQSSFREHKVEDARRDGHFVGTQEMNVKDGRADPTLSFVAANSSTTNTTKYLSNKVNCLMHWDFEPVEIVNPKRLTELLVAETGSTNRSKNEKDDRQIPATCILLLFYTKHCTFSSAAAPHFNALPHFFPQIKAVAIDAHEHQNFITQYGVVGVPTLMLIHNGKPVAKFNHTSYVLESFAKFITHYTNLQPIGFLYLVLSDFLGPLSNTPTNGTDYCLVLSWVFIAACALYFTTKSRWWQQFVELVQNTWRESNAQHEHAD